MRPDQCGTGRSAFMAPGDRAAILAFISFLESGAPDHLREIQRIRAGGGPRQLLPGPPHHAGDLVKVTEGRYTGRWGRVVDVHDYRHLHVIGADNSQRLSFLIAVELLVYRKGDGLVPYPPGPVPFEPHELAPLHSGAGDWTKGGRVVSRRNWPTGWTGLQDPRLQDPDEPS